MNGLNEAVSVTALTYAWVALLSVYGGLAQHLAQVKRGECKFSWSALSGDVALSGFVGLLTSFAVDSAGLDPKQGALLTGISAHMGVRTLYLFGEQWEQILKRLFKAVLRGK